MLHLLAKELFPFICSEIKQIKDEKTQRNNQFSLAILRAG
jgi:hypothetical protein